MPILFTEPSHLFPFEVETVGIDWLQEPITRPSGFHSHHLLQGNAGSGLITLNDQEIKLDVGDLLLIAPHIPHHYHGTSHRLWHTNFLTFIGDSTRSLAEFFHYSDYIFIENSQKPYLEEIFKVVEKQGSQNDNFQSSLLLYELLSYVKGNMLAQTSEHAPASTSQQLLPVIQYIKKNLAQPLRLNELAQQIYVSPQYLIRLFQKHLNCSPNDYLIQQRIKKAKSLLIEQPEQSISQIGEGCGFNSASYFIKVFKDFTQLTPNHFRKIYKH